MRCSIPASTTNPAPARAGPFPWASHSARPMRSSWHSTTSGSTCGSRARDRWPPFVEQESPNPHRSGADSGRRPSRNSSGKAGVDEPSACSTMAGTANRRSTNSCAIRAGQSLAHVFTLLSLVLPSQPLQIAFRSLHSQNSRLRGTALEYLEGVLPAESPGAALAVSRGGAHDTPFSATRRSDRRISSGPAPP